MLYMHLNSPTIAPAIAIKKLIDEHKFANEAEALIHYCKQEFKAELAVFNNPINVCYTELDGASPLLVINKTLEHIEATNPDRIVFGIRGIVRLRDTVNEIEPFKKQCQLVKHKECEDCKKEAERKAA